MPAKIIEVQRNLNDGELYDKRLKDKAAEWYAMVPSTSRHYRDAQKRLGEK